MDVNTSSTSINRTEMESQKKTEIIEKRTLKHEKKLSKRKCVLVLFVIMFVL